MDRPSRSPGVFRREAVNLVITTRMPGPPELSTCSASPMPQVGARRTAQTKNRRHTPEEVVRKLAEADKLLAQGKAIEEVPRRREISGQTLGVFVPMIAKGTASGESGRKR